MSVHLVPPTPHLLNERNGSDAWYMSLVDWGTGKTVYEYWVGSGKNFTDMLQPVVIHSGAFCIGTNTGLLVIRDN